nr:hydantoinase B/oxoprolinase family protein [Sphingomonas sp. Y57]
MNMHSATPSGLHTYTPHRRASAGKADRADPIVTQVVRHALNSATNRMKQVVIRTSFQPVIYEFLDFAAALYDRQVRLLSQAPTMPLFMGTMSFCVEAAVNAVGGEAALDEGDVILYNMPFGTGSHAPDMAVIMPAFYNGELVGYTAAKAHLIDLGAKDPYPSDSIDMFQEGLLLDGVKLFRRGELVEDILKIVLSNSRAPTAIKGDLLAVVAACRAGSEEFATVIDRFGMDVFLDCTERMFDHGEAVVRAFIAELPDGRYEALGHLDSDGLGGDPVELGIALIVSGDHVTFDLSAVPDALKGPLNSPLPATVAACRIALAMLAGNDTPNEGHYRPLKVISRPGSIFHPVAPQPTFLYFSPLMQLIEAIYEALSTASPGRVPSGSAGDICGATFHRFDEVLKESIIVGSPLPIGHGATSQADGSILYPLLVGQNTLPSVELQEAKFPFIGIESWEIEPDSGGAGQYRGGMGWKASYRILRDVFFMTPIDRAKVPSWGQAGGHSGAANWIRLTYPDGSSEYSGKVTGKPLPAGTLVEIFCGGGGGYGEPSARAPDKVLDDVRMGYFTEGKARELYPHAFAQAE